jgi:BirA family biotin operon repressor/biotin-[acetyl-CoA-carboxylase] ligase
LIEPRELLQALAAGDALSGAELARQSGVTRAAVWKQIEHLRAHGLPILARRGAGYVLPWPIQLLDGADIRARLTTQPGMLELHWDLDSTSSECLRRADTLADGSIVLAEMQHAGRGRRGRGWLSPPGLNLYLSCLKRFDCGFTALSGLSLAVGVAVVRTLESLALRGVGLKWPNDVLVAASGAKLAGILVELRGEYQGPSTAVIGVGLNLRLPRAMRERAGQATADLAELAAHEGSEPPDRNRVAARLIDHLLAAMTQFDEHGFSVFADEYAHLDLLRDRTLTLSGNGRSFDATGAGVDARGALRVHGEQGITLIDSADVTVRAQ